MPAELADHKWVQGVTGLTKQLEKSLSELDVAKINAAPGSAFDPDLHNAIQFG